MATPAHLQEFENVISITPRSPHTYTIDLSTEWAVGSVPNGGYVSAVLYRLAKLHFQRAHPKRHNSRAQPIAIQLSFLRKTSVGRAVLNVQDLKLGQRLSTILVTLSQGATPVSKVMGLITVSDEISETGVSVPSTWQPPSYPFHQFMNRDDDPQIGGSPWKQVVVQHPAFRRAATHTEAYVPDAPQPRTITAQWCRFRPSGHKGRWTNESLTYLADIFPTALADLENAANAASRDEPKLFWFPTVTLNIDFKQVLPPEGVEWLFSRVVMKVIQNGRTDINVEILDMEGKVVALASQVGLIMSAARNVGAKM